MTYEEAIIKQVEKSGRGITEIGYLKYKVECMVNRHRYYLGVCSSKIDAEETLINFRLSYLEDQIETAGFNIWDGTVINNNYILFEPDILFTLYGKRLAINYNQYGVPYARINDTTKSFRKN